MELFIILLLISFNLALATVSGWVANKIGRSFGKWFFISLLFPVIALCVLICLPDVPEPAEPIVEEGIVRIKTVSYLIRQEDIILN
jgi:hypothetical protein